MTTRNDIARWLSDGKEMKATHVIVVCDTFDHGDYPVYVQADEDVREKAREYGYPGQKNMQRVMEVYSLSKDLEFQLNEHRAFHFD